MSTITVVAVSGCLLIVTLFVVIFTVLQKRSQTMYTGIKYNKLGKKPPSGGGSRTTRISIPADGDDLLEPIVNNDDEEEDEEEEEDDDENDYDGSSASDRLATAAAAGAGDSDQEEETAGQFDSRRLTAKAVPARGKRTFRYVASTRT